MLALTGLCCLVAACGGAPGDTAAPGTSGSPATTGVQASEKSAGASFQAAVSGDLEMTVAGEGAIAGTRYGRYHLSFSGQPGGDAGAVIISLARGDTASPGPGTYTLGEGGDFDGNIEVHPGPADYAIDDGELVITAASGDALAGRYMFSAQERGGAAAITVEGSFQTRAAD
ncbi:hypothetical protein [Luteimonas sp. A649]